MVSINLAFDSRNGSGNISAEKAGNRYGKDRRKMADSTGSASSGSIYIGGNTKIRFGDTYAYRSVFREAPSKIAALPLYLEGIKKDKGFSVLIVIIKALIGNSPILFFMFIATVQMLCMAFIYRKYSENYWMSIFVFVAGTDYMFFGKNTKNVNAYLGGSIPLGKQKTAEN